MKPRRHHELLTSEAGGMALAFLVLLRPIAGALINRAQKALGRRQDDAPTPKGE